MTDASADVFVYRIDRSDAITDVDEAWVTFARVNGAATLTAATVEGQSLWRYVIGVELSLIYRQLFKDVRSGRKITIPFRCDSPTQRRYFEMRMTVVEDAGIQFENRVLRQEVQDPGPVTLLDPSALRSDVSVLMCSWCKRVKEPTGDWLPLERAVVVLQLLSTTPPPSLTHGICPSCQSGIDLG